MTAAPADLRLFVPASASAQAREAMTRFGQVLAALPPRPLPVTQADFDAAAARGATFAEVMNQGAIEALAPTVEVIEAGGVPVLRVDPRTPTTGAAPLVYIHGGGFVGGSARANLLTAALAAEATGRRVFSIDYVLAPRADWRAMQGEILRAWMALAAANPGALGLIGDSAGGCLALALALRLREAGADLPGALVALSPVTDLAGEGDTIETLSPADFLPRETLDIAVAAYAPGADLKDPLVSPVHADFAPGFPPVLLQVGTREALLSDSVRLHRALRAAGRESRLEVYEAMPHVFQNFLAGAPEGRQAWAEIAAFLEPHLCGASGVTHAGC
ncbi:MAG: Alpha/beta hydrolase fold-3 domain protein [Caulobacter sp.]|nr:Alpha/beta hydrolase fold-3 domain protein [Caulobacter sp.]